MRRHAVSILALAWSAGVAFAQPSSSVVDALDAQPLILFSLQNPPRNHGQETVAAQAARQVRLLRGLLDQADPSDGQRELGRRLRDSLFSVSRYVLNNESPGPSLELARALMPYVTADMARAVHERGERLFGIESSPLGPRSYLYDAARAIRANLRQADGTLEPELARELLGGLIGAVPFGPSRSERQFITQFVVHELALEVCPSLPSSGGHRFKDWIDLTEVAGDVGKWIDGLAGALTLGGRKANTARLAGHLGLTVE